MKRLVEMHGNTNLSIMRWHNGRKKQQQFTFDQVKKVLRNNHWKNYVIEIQSSGNGQNAITSATISSRWW